jgi:hypothetical protein
LKIDLVLAQIQATAADPMSKAAHNLGCVWFCFSTLLLLLKSQKLTKEIFFHSRFFKATGFSQCIFQSRYTPAFAAVKTKKG